MNSKDASPEVIGRREFLQQIEAVAVTAVCGGRGALPLMLAACGGVRYVTASRIGMQLVLPLKALGRGSALVESPNDKLPIFLRRLDDGQFSAVSTRCMHKGCQVEPSSDRLVCPCHGSEYTFEGGVLKGPTEQSLIRYRVSSDDSSVYIHLDSPLPTRTS